MFYDAYNSENNGDASFAAFKFEDRITFRSSLVLESVKKDLRDI